MGQMTKKSNLVLKEDEISVLKEDKISVLIKEDEISN
jgi:hypothetical protein